MQHKFSEEESVLGKAESRLVDALVLLERRVLKQQQEAEDVKASNKKIAVELDHYLLKLSHILQPRG